MELKHERNGIKRAIFFNVYSILLSSLIMVSALGQEPAQQLKEMGTVKSIGGGALSLKADSGRDVSVVVPDGTRIERLAPGQTDLKTVTPMQLQGIAVGDRILIHGKPGNSFSSVIALYIVVMKQGDVTQKQQQDEATAGQAAEQVGKLREALAHYVAALQTVQERKRSFGDFSTEPDQDQHLREKVIALAQKLKPAPAMPEAARTHFGRGQAAFEIAKDSDDFRRAANEFQQALKLAPWLANGYFDLGKAQDKSDQYAEAIRSFKLYLLAAPSAPDADDVKTRIAGLEYKIERSKEEAGVQQEKAQQEATAARQQEEEHRRTQGSLSSLEGLWYAGSFEYRLSREGETGFLIVVVRSFSPFTHEWKTVHPNSPWGRMRFHGVVSGNLITGTADARCGGLQSPMTGELLDGGHKIVVRGQEPADCTSTHFPPNSPWNQEFMRQCIGRSNFGEIVCP